MGELTDCIEGQCPQADPAVRWQARLEAERNRMVETVLQIRVKCERAGSSPKSGNAILTQQLLSAAVRDLEILDEHLYEIRGREGHS